MKILTKTFIVNFFFLIVIFFSSCKKDDPTPKGEISEIVVTDVKLKFFFVDGPGGGVTFDVNASDPNGIGLGINPTIGTINLEKGRNYSLKIELFNSLENKNITEEIKIDPTKFQFYFLGSGFTGNNAPLQFSYDDVDAQGNPIGLNGFIVTSENPSDNNAQFQLVLIHDLDKNFPGAGNPHWTNISQSGGNTVFFVNFPVNFN